MRLGDFGVVNLAEPVVGRDRARIGQNQAAHGVGDGRVLLDAPVVDVQVVVHHLAVVQRRAGGLLRAALVQAGIGLRHARVAAAAEHSLHAAADLPRRDQAGLNPALEVAGHHNRQVVDRAVGILDAVLLKRPAQGVRDFLDPEGHSAPIRCLNLIHSALSPQ